MLLDGKWMRLCLAMMLLSCFSLPGLAADSKGEIVGKPAHGSKFAKLKPGMTLKKVDQLIGAPSKEWQHPTGKSAIPFYYGDDRWVIQRSYKGEGILTFNGGGDQELTKIEVDRNEGKK